MKILFYVKRGLYECIKIYFNINFLYNHPKASKRPLIAVPIIMNNPVGPCKADFMLSRETDLVKCTLENSNNDWTFERRATI